MNTIEQRSWTLALGTVLTAIGVAMAMFARGRFFDLNPGILGAMTATVVGASLAAAEGLRYTRLLMVLSPIVAAQAFTSLGAEPAFLGHEMAFLGLVGLALASRMPAPARAARRVEQAERGARHDSMPATAH